MSLFQHTILKKQILASSGKIREAYKVYAAYFHNPKIQENIRNSKEEQFQEGFLRELFVKILGYTLNPESNYNLITEKKNETDSKKADGAILVNGEVKAVIELKDHKTTDLKQVEAQAFGYKNNNRKTSYVIISNFEKLRFYIENTIDFEEFNLFNLTEDAFAVLWICLACENIAKDLPKQLKNESNSSEDHITKQLYKEYSTFKRALFDDLTKYNIEYDQLTLFKKSQKLLDRLLFILFAEDCGLLPPNSIMEIIKQWETLKELDEYKPLYDRLKKYFGYMNTGHKGKKHDIFAYNGGLFSPDEVLDNILISDEVLLSHLSTISHYDFSSEVDVNILGHIFENSLTEIEEITNAISTNTELQTIGKRKKDGVFYTPRYITTYIVENTLGKLCTDKKAELEIDESEYVTDKRRQKTTKLKLEQKLIDYRNWLLSLTILDPACGSGAFLNAALDFLIVEHRLIDEMRAKIYDGAYQVFDNIENAILENNLYGVDINEESVEIAKLALWLRTAKPNRKLNSLNNNIKCGNSLISDPEVAGEKAFDWHKEFPHIFEKGGFDVVIGNPPYVGIQSIDWDLRRYYEKLYQNATGRFDLYSLFIEKTLQIKKLAGNFSFIIPGKFLNNKQFVTARKMMCQGHSVFVVKIDDKVFEEAAVDSVIVGSFASENPIYKVSQIGKEVVKDLSEMNISSLLQDDEVIFRLELDGSVEKLISKIVRETIPVKKIGEVKDGIVAGKIKDILFLDKKIDEDSHKLYFGKHLSRYRLDDTDVWVNYKPEEMMRVEIERQAGKRSGLWMRDEKIFNREKILSRFVAREIIATYDDENKYYEHTLHSTHIIDKRLSTKYVLALFNSQLFKFYYQKTNSQGGNIFPQVRISSVENLPIKIADKETQQTLSNLTDKMLLLNSDLQTKRQRFLKRLSDNFNTLKITGALERFDELEFNQFLAELAKQKITLSLKQQDEWEEYFNEYKTECCNFVSQIQATDKEIDEMVYALYGLTEEEVEIVENKT